MLVRAIIVLVLLVDQHTHFVLKQKMLVTSITREAQKEIQ